MSVFSYKLSTRPGPLSVEDYRERARRKLPDMVWAYVDYGADDLVTLAANRAAFSQYALRARMLTGNEATDLSVTVGGRTISLPVLLAPTGLVGLSHWTGELGAAQAAERADTISILSTSSSYSFEEVAAGTRTDHFFQLYPWTEVGPGARRHDLNRSLMDRASRAGFSAMFVTADTATAGNRESELKRGMGKPPVVNINRAISVAMHPRWGANLLKHKRISGRNLVDTVGARAAMRSLDIQLKRMSAELNWDDVAWMRENWEGPLYVKGILDADDAEKAMDVGADGVVVSNHGGRQLDCAPATLHALPAIVDRVGHRGEVLFDGGIRRGSDVVKALCLGAKAVCIGRPYLYGMAAAGPDGAQHVIEILREEIARTMTLMGVSKLEDLTPDCLLPADRPVPTRASILG